MTIAALIFGILGLSIGLTAFLAQIGHVFKHQTVEDAKDAVFSDGYRAGREDGKRSR